MEQRTVQDSHEKRGIALAIISVLCFSATSLMLGYISSEHGVDSWVAATYRGVIGLLVITALQKRTGRLELKHLITNRLLFIRGLIGGIAIPIYYLCIMELGPGRAGLIAGSYPLFAAIFAMFLIKEGLNRSYFSYIVIALLGLGGVFAESAFVGGKPMFDSIAIGNAAAAGFCVVMIRHLRHSETTSTIFASQCVFTVLISAFAAGEQLLIQDTWALTLTIIASITVVCGQLSVTESFRHLNVAKGSIMQMLTPALTVLLSASILGEQFGLLELIGGGAILFASYRIVMSRSKS